MEDRRDAGTTQPTKDVPYLVKDYPRPAPPVQRKQDIFDPDDFTDIHTTQIPDENLSDFAALVGHLTDGLTTDVQKVWAIFSWIGNQNVLDTKYPDATDPYTPRAFLKGIQEDPSLYAKLFAILCREAEIPCVVLSGRAKAGRYEVGDKEIGYSTWNAVYVAEGWRFVHCNWAFISVIGSNVAGWLKVEEDGKRVTEDAETSDGERKHEAEFNDSYFLVDPDVFIYFCRPKQDAWQLLRSPISIKRFIALPFVRPAFTETGLSFRSGQEGTIRSNMGECDVIIRAQKRTCQFNYTLYYKKDSGKEFPDAQGSDRYVAMINRNQDGEVKFRVRFPIEGTYKLSLFVKKSKVFLWMCDFKLVCEQRKAGCDPLPETPAIGWGPGITARSEGLYNISHDDGIIESKDGKNIEVSFNVKGKQKIKPRLKHARLPDKKMKQFISTSFHNGTVNIRLRPDDGEYALVIDNEKEHAGQKNVLNYIIEAGEPNRRPVGFRENATERMTRQQLKEATRERRKDDIIAYIARFNKMKLEDKGHLTKARQTLESIEIRETLRFALMRERSDELEKAIRRARSSDVGVKLEADLERAESALNNLLHRNSVPRHLSAVTQRNVAELRALRTLTVPLQEIFTALFLLLGENRSRLQDSGYVLALLKRSGPDGLLSRLERFQPSQVKPEVVHEAKKLLERHQDDNVSRICAPVGKVYQKGKDLVDRYTLTRSPSIHNDGSSSPVVDDQEADDTDTNIHSSSQVN
ncbi:hillarin-like [Haliotis asinina]|uniref:hillarin-like n=1 Tax=Haliotis asinina TaxID=109174 RepID=UPI0035321990